MADLKDILITPLKRIQTGDTGEVLHALRASEPCFAGFGEVYFSSVKQGATKGWKRHKRMTANLIVPCGTVAFHFAEREDGRVVTHRIGEDFYARLTVPPGLWTAFTGESSGLNLILNAASLEHDDEEEERLPLSAFTINL